MRNSLTNLRNIGISAHIDSGKTTLSERILYYAGRIHRVQEVRGEGATMDHMDLEKERGITITSAATTVQWKGARINLIDTPGHVDFTVEVERSLRVLDGAVLVLCAVGGVQAQSITIDRQMHRYHIPRVAFINKMDRTGANPDAVVRQLRDKLGCDAMLMQRPIGSEARFAGVVDLVTRKALYFDGPLGEQVRIEDVPPSMEEEVRRGRQELLEALAMYSDELMELLLAEEEVPEAMIREVVRSAVHGEQFTPVFLGTAYRNKGVQPLLDAVVHYLPSPLDCENQALVHGQTETKIRLEPSPDKPTVAMAFKIVEDPYGLDVHADLPVGRLAKGETYFNFSRTGHLQGAVQPDRADARRRAGGHRRGFSRRHRGRARSRLRQRRPMPRNTPTARCKACSCPNRSSRSRLHRSRSRGAERLAKALHRIPPRGSDAADITTDQETGETLIAGMGELHLEVYVERIRREHGVLVEVGPPKVNYREAPTQEARFDVRHKKQSGGGAVRTRRWKLLPLDQSQEETFLVRGLRHRRADPAAHPRRRERIPPGIVKGPVAGYPVVGLHVILEDGSYHEDRQLDLAFARRDGDARRRSRRPGRCCSNR